MMIRVGDYLSDTVAARGSVAEKDVFGRSAFNRYYYAAFLIVRYCLLRLDSNSWGMVKHGNVPDVLNKVRKELIRAKKQAHKDNVLNGKDSKVVAEGVEAARALRALMQTAYDVRCIADYEPEVQLQFRSDVYFLKDVTNLHARRWVSKADGFSDKIIAAWRTLAL